MSNRAPNWDHWLVHVDGSDSPVVLSTMLVHWEPNAAAPSPPAVQWCMAGLCASPAPPAASATRRSKRVLGISDTDHGRRAAARRAPPQAPRPSPMGRPAALAAAKWTSLEVLRMLDDVDAPDLPWLQYVEPGSGPMHRLCHFLHPHEPHVDIQVDIPLAAILRVPLYQPMLQSEWRALRGV